MNLTCEDVGCPCVEHAEAARYCPECQRSTVGRCAQHAIGVTHLIVGQQIAQPVVTINPVVTAGLLPTGWQCPCCKRCYSPSTTECRHCGPMKCCFGSCQQEY